MILIHCPNSMSSVIVCRLDLLHLYSLFKVSGSGCNDFTKFAGLEDRCHGNEELVHLVNTDERFSEIKVKILLNTDVLIIDKVSIVSLKVIESVEHLCRSLREALHQFWWNSDYFKWWFPPSFAVKRWAVLFRSHFYRIFPHIIHLTTVHRQPDNVHISCINELEKGTPSKKTTTNDLMIFFIKVT